MKEIDCEPSRSEGAGECAIRIIKKLQARIAELEEKNAGLISRSMVVNSENIALKNDYAEVKDRIKELEAAFAFIDKHFTCPCDSQPSGCGDEICGFKRIVTGDFYFKALESEVDK